MSGEHTRHDERWVLISADFFEDLVNATGDGLTIEYGPSHTRTITYHTPTVYEPYEPQDADPLTIGQDD
jgi:hypothetical protein